ncbi:hypothetical protein [Actinophytocola sp.]|uniref:hypothetical protein n=1 Tax=Actinophytocola sp. TaxID=1872138 RepID=UPI003D6AAD8B
MTAADRTKSVFQTDNRKMRPQQSSSWDDLGWSPGQGGARVSKVTVGHQGDVNAPVIVMVEFPPHAVVPPHSHPSDYVEVILSGSQQVTGKWHHAGDVRIVKAGTGYGPLIAGPEGAVVAIVFSSGDMAPTWLSKDSTGAETE